MIRLQHCDLRCKDNSSKHEGMGHRAWGMEHGVRGQELEVRGKRSEVGGQTTEGRRQNFQIMLLRFERFQLLQ